MVQETPYLNHSVQQLADNLTVKQVETILFCERDGNGKHIFQIHRLAQMGLMSLVPIPKLQMVPAYRLNTLGLAVRSVLRKDRLDHTAMCASMFVSSDPTLSTEQTTRVLINFATTVINEQLVE